MDDKDKNLSLLDYHIKNKKINITVPLVHCLVSLLLCFPP